MRDKNFTCVVIFSLGNESAWGKMFYKGADYLKEHDSRPIHYEGIFCLYNKSDEYYTDRLDIISRMYPEYEWLKKDYLNDPKETRPLVLCEYSHAMGNSCGDFLEYWNTINSNDRFIGAFVWEWCDHALLVDGKLRYGGDSHEKPHDSNFCVDGLVTPFREFKSSTLEMKAVYGGKNIADKKINKCYKLLDINEKSKLVKKYFYEEEIAICLNIYCIT